MALVEFKQASTRELIFQHKNPRPDPCKTHFETATVRAIHVLNGGITIHDENGTAKGRRIEEPGLNLRGILQAVAEHEGEGALDNIDVIVQVRAPSQKSNEYRTGRAWLNQAVLKGSPLQGARP